jgi:hypothetical protein
LRFWLKNDLARAVWFKFYFAVAGYPYSKSGAHCMIKFRRLATAAKRRIKFKIYKTQNFKISRRAVSLRGAAPNFHAEATLAETVYQAVARLSCAMAYDAQHEAVCDHRCVRFKQRRRQIKRAPTFLFRACAARVHAAQPQQAREHEPAIKRHFY